MTKEERIFFFEKKKQKTFARFARGLRAANLQKSFSFFFFRKRRFFLP
jgi:hypothetical protein